jgi:hypothetical protein
LQTTYTVTGISGTNMSYASTNNVVSFVEIRKP